MFFILADLDNTIPRETPTVSMLRKEWFR
jgi:hypothetical protein